MREPGEVKSRPARNSTLQELVKKRLELMGQAVFKGIQFPCNYFGKARWEAGSGKQPTASLYRVVPNVVTNST